MSEETALGGLRVLDLSESVAGQFCSRLLADYGASVILVEPPSGSAIRALPPFRIKAGEIVDSLLFWHLNTDKRSITLDWHQPSGHRILGMLARQADILITDRSLDREAFRAINPRLITCLVSDFGETGPRADWQGSELIHQALGGTMFTTGELGREPLYGMGHRTQYATGVTAYITILAALHARDSETLDAGPTRRGQDVEASVAEAVAAMGQAFATQYQYNGTYFQRERYPNVLRLIHCRDGWAVVFANERWGAICAAFKREELATDPRFSTLVERQKHWREAVALLQESAQHLSVDEVVQEAQKNKAVISKVMNLPDVWEDEHLRVRGFWERVKTPHADRVVLGPVFRMSETPRQPLRPAPGLGQDNSEILGALGITSDEIEQLRAVGIV